MALTQLASVDAALGWLAGHGVRALTTDSRRVAPGDAFVAWPGYGTDGRQYVPDAFAAGARACLVEAEGVRAYAFDDDARIAALAGLKPLTGALAAAFLGRPSESLDVVAVTGTNGKTSTTWWVAQALTALGRRCGVIGTLGVGEPPGGELVDGAATISFTGMTTPDPVTVQSGFKRFVDAGFAACAIEATSIGIEEHRLAGTTIDVALYTNLTLDHLDYHGSMASYWQAKARLFAWPGLRAAVVNVDDAHGAALVPTLRDGLDVWTYSALGAQGQARLHASDIGYAGDDADGGGLRFVLHERGAAAPVDVRTRLIGDYNVANLLATIGGLRALGVALADAARVCAGLTPVPGRMDRVRVDALRVDAERVQSAGASAAAGLPQVVVDYAHTPDALEKALLALRPFAAQRGGALWCVFGCGGNRDQGKRPLMGALAQRLADQVVATSDNPRSEAPAFILLQIVAGLKGSQERFKVIEDRRSAIRHAVRHADARDVILIAGKGHEDYQEVRGVKHPFSDSDEAAAALAMRLESPS